MDVGALHLISGRQWRLEDDPARPIWPDSVLVVPFGAPVEDATKTVANPRNGSSIQGGWTVTSSITKLELWDLVEGKLVAPVSAVWIAGPGGDVPVLHILGNDPFAWLTPHLDAAATAKTTSYPYLEQWFGDGPSEQFVGDRRFAELVVQPGATPAQLLVPPHPWLPRVLHAPGALLSFSYPSGPAIPIDRLALGMLLAPEETVGEGLTPSSSIKIGTAGWRLALVDIPIGPGSNEGFIPVTGSILYVRYRHASKTVTTPEQITLKPGHYRLLLEGMTTGTAPSTDFEDAAALTWAVDESFYVELPRSLRPYVRYTTFGDDRLFGAKTGFDPTLPGVGFPAHLDYLPVVRFSVPHVNSMFEKLKLRVDYVNPNLKDVAETVQVLANTALETSLPDASVAWQTGNGGSVPPDDEVVMQAALSDPGDASLRISYVSPVGEEVELDSWGVRVSKFANAAAQLAWPGTSITRFYRQDGPHDLAPCPTITGPKWKDTVTEAGLSMVEVAAELIRRSTPHRDTKTVARPPAPPAKTARTSTADLTYEAYARSVAGRLLKPPGGTGKPMPAEYATPPDDWPLPSVLALLAKPVDEDAARRYLLFLWRSGIRLTKASEPRLAGVAKPVGTTTIEAVCDNQNRPLALWLRTPEPIDWRRVHAELALRHVEPDGGCPNAYAYRQVLALVVHLLPSIDGSAALVVAELAGVPTRLPRGEITLGLTYEPGEPGLVRLRPRTKLASDHEVLSLTFLQPLGKTWPVKPPEGPVKVRRPPKLREPLHFGPPEPRPWRSLVTNEFETSDLTQLLELGKRGRR